MSAEDSDDVDVYPVDFTTASAWEVFIARIEEIIQDWSLHSKKRYPPKLKLSMATWHSRSETISFSDVKFKMTHHYASFPGVETTPVEESGKSNNLPLAFEELMSSDNDFPPVELLGEEETRPHVLARWYGLREFVVLTPLAGPIIQESKIKVLISSLCIALNNADCEIPMFVRSLEFWQSYYMGICEGRGVRGEFEMVHLKKVPQQCKYLTGLLSVFKSKIGNNPANEPVTVAACFSYILPDWSIFQWAVQEPNLDLSEVSEMPKELTELPFGSAHEPIESLTLHTYWPEILESVVADSETYSDFEPLDAPIWAVSVVKASNPLCLLSDYLTEFLLHSSINLTKEELIGDIAGRDMGAGDISQTFNLLTESRLPNLTSMLTAYALRKKSNEGPIPNKLLMPLIYYIFPDAESNPIHPYSEDNDKSKSVSHRMKTCADDSLIWRLAIIAAHALSAMGGARAVAHLWHEFCQELRFRWNTSNFIPGVAPGLPDSKTCLLHQKLQMINCCIERRIKRNEELAQSTANEDEEFKQAPEFSEESEDEFFDCESAEANNSGGADSLPQPQGRLYQHETLTLLKTGQPLYIPVTQGETPKTEDQLEEESEVLIKLGSDAEGSLLRAKLMSVSLRSEMEAFKAANPGAVIEDFIRWYSPRDWVEEDESDEFGRKKGHLSDRMQLPGNTWLEVWASARGIPAKRQKRLFDETSEGEKALHLIESRDPGAAAFMLLPVLAHVGVKRLEEEAASIPLPMLQSLGVHSAKKLEAITRQSPNDSRRYHELFLEMGQAETIISQVRSLEFKLCCEGVDPSLAWRLTCEPEVTLPGGPSAIPAQRVKLLFSQAAKAIEAQMDSSLQPYMPGNGPILKEANEREFTLRLSAPRPSKKSRLCPQRLTAKVSKAGIQMAGLFSQDTAFF